MRRSSWYVLISLFILLSPAAAHAATPLEISGWIPYWRVATGTIDTISHIQELNAVMPFGYTVKNDGALYDAWNIASSTYFTALTGAAHTSRTKIIPTIMWSDGSAIQKILSNGRTRRALEQRVADLVKKNHFDGADIDFEGKLAKTEPYFSLFLQGLYARMGQKWVYCSIEPRTPPKDAFEVVPANIQYANDYRAINKYCDRVELMTYDQGTIDLTLNAMGSGPYIPVADPAWVKAVVQYAEKTISKRKLMIGVATYGYEYTAMPLSQLGYRYNLDWAFDPNYALQIESPYNVSPTRNRAGELSVMYTPTSTAATTPAVSQGSVIPVQNLAVPSTDYASTSATSTVSVPRSFNILWWSDASAIADKIALARQLGVRGIAIFKLDGGEDPNMWSVLHP